MDLFVLHMAMSTRACKQKMDKLMRENVLTNEKAAEIFSRLLDEYGITELLFAEFLLLVRFYSLVGEANSQH